MDRLGVGIPPVAQTEFSGLVHLAGATGGDAGRCVELARGLSERTPLPGQGRTAERWSLLASIAAGDLSAARIAEAHLDALAILAEAGTTDDALGPLTNADLTWGVFAAEGPGVRVDATETSGGFVLTGTKPWCSAASLLDRALVTAHVDGSRRLFAVDLTAPSVTTTATGWVSRGLREVVSGPITLHAAPATPVGDTGWYLQRPGFAWGGIGVAACWYGGLVGVARTLWSAARRREPDQIAQLLVGTADLAVQAAGAALASAAAAVDAGDATGACGVRLAERVRGAVAGAAEQVVAVAGHALGPGPLVGDEDHARRVADLQIYVRQHHAERDTSRLGALILDAAEPPW